MSKSAMRSRLRRRNGRAPARRFLAGDPGFVRSATLVLGVVAMGGLAAVPASAAAPAGRAYELISPVDDASGAIGGLSTDLFPLPGVSSADGDHFLYGAGSVLGPAWSGPANLMVFGRRTASGWGARPAIRSLDNGNTAVELSSGEAQSGVLTPDGLNYIFGMAGNLGAAPTAPAEVLPGVYRSPDDDVAPDWLSRPADGIAPYASAQARGPLAISTTSSRDGDVVAFSSTAPLTADAPALNTSAVYAVRHGQLELASRMPDGSVPTLQSFMPNAANAGAGAQNPPAVTHRNQVAGDGRFVLFRVGGAAPDGALGTLYVRDLEQQVTRQLAGGAPGVPELATSLSRSWGGAGQTINVDLLTVPDGSLVFGARDSGRAYFKGERTSLATPAFLYEANLETGAITARTAITGAPLGLSADGERMLFIEPPAGGTAAGDWTLKFWDRSNPAVSVTVGTIASSSSPPFGRARVYRSSADGRTWIFTAIGSPDPARPNVSANTQQLYRWTVGENAPTCLSCQPIDGVARTSGVNLTVQEAIATEEFATPTTAGSTSNSKFGNHKRKLSQPGRSISDDGRWLLFDSPDRLTAADTNNVRDVYLWDRDRAPGDQLQLVTSGLGTTPSFALDVDATGKNAFFSTREGLVPADRNGNYNVYTARIDGGFPEPPAPCAGEECRRPTVPAPSGGSIGSNVLLAPPPGPKQGVQKGSPKLRIRSIRTSTRRVTVRVDTPLPGRISVSGKYLRTTKRTAKRATTYTLKVPLSVNARRRVASGKSVKVKLRVQFTPSGSKKAQRVSSSVSVKKGR